MLLYFTFVFLSIILHEFAHALVAECFGLRTGLVFTRRGIGIKHPIGLWWQNALIAVAGPVMSAALAVVFWPNPYLRWGNAVLAALCLLDPREHSDGGRIWGALAGTKIKAN